VCKDARGRREYCQPDLSREGEKWMRYGVGVLVLVSLPQIIGRGLAPPDRLRRRDAHAFQARVPLPLLLLDHNKQPEM
jgi:hypothetical protein